MTKRKQDRKKNEKLFLKAYKMIARQSKDSSPTVNVRIQPGI